ncbi:hypothetical protein [Deinococcus gobiensis]|uniref:hypothetical protein n=1 Tax=Deinococcus gobiensis TaxID=502394 RepID=UPI0005C1E700|nr:hypothetical protein [Deinococcus gobiensis]
MPIDSKQEHRVVEQPEQGLERHFFFGLQHSSSFAEDLKPETLAIPVHEQGVGLKAVGGAQPPGQVRDRNRHGLGNTASALGSP